MKGYQHKKWHTYKYQYVTKETSRITYTIITHRSLLSLDFDIDKQNVKKRPEAL